ncbi:MULTISPECIES: potassium channel family protein [Brevibacillus]|uniref:potassium channel family protein n=1 Tax=Brevibacillus TaxID=55080 RepID=UPI0018FFC2A1|nr:potassium channel family protein [Brevibacillus brevis]MBH0330568.1 potassium channel protein [Brevibacillus brevis]WJQ80082.1 potassium channel family protein [Brevibacillus brevis]
MFWRVMYEIFIIMLVITYAILLFADFSNHPLLTDELMDKVDTWLIIMLIVEYLVRLWRAEDKRKFVLANWFDLIAMIPLDSYLYLARIMRVLRLVRIVRASPFLLGIIRSGPMRQVFGVVTIIMLWSSTAIYLLEYGVNENIKSFPDALWWSIVTTTTVGYGDISPVTSGGRIMAAILMITGIGMLGALTANFATHWTETHESKSPDEKDRLTEEIKKQTITNIRQIENLTEREYETLKESMDLLYRRTRKKSEE